MHSYNKNKDFNNKLLGCKCAYLIDFRYSISAFLFTLSIIDLCRAYDYGITLQSHDFELCTSRSSLIEMLWFCHFFFRSSGSGASVCERDCVCEVIAAMMQQKRNLQIIEWEDLDKRKFYSLGVFMTMTTRATVYPFTLIRTRLQVQKGNSLYNGTFDAFCKILKAEGARGLYRGFMVNSFTLISVRPTSLPTSWWGDPCPVTRPITRSSLWWRAGTGLAGGPKHHGAHRRGVPAADGAGSGGCQLTRFKLKPKMANAKYKVTFGPDQRHCGGRFITRMDCGAFKFVDMWRRSSPTYPNQRRLVAVLITFMEVRNDEPVPTKPVIRVIFL